MRILLLFIALSLSGWTTAQFKQKVADQFYANLEYAKCVDMYDELASKCLKKPQKGSWENVRKSAISHYHLFQMKDAIRRFEQLDAENMLTEDDRVIYIHALRYDERYGKSNEIIRESANLHKDNTFFQSLLADKKKFEALFADSSLFKVWEASINSGKGDFGPAYFNNSLVFVSKAENAGFVNPKYGWDGDFFLNVHQAPLLADSVLGSREMLKHNFLSRAHDGPVSFNADGSEMVITKNRSEKVKGKKVVVLGLYFSKIENGEWSELQPFEFNDPSFDVGHGVFSKDGKKLYFASNKPGGSGGADIYVSERLGKGWSEPRNLGPEINTERDELFPFVMDDMLYFASNGHFGLGGLDIFEVHLSGGAPKNCGAPVNSAHDDFSLIYDDSGELGFFSSNRGDNIDRIYHVKRNIFNIQLNGTVVMKYKELEALPNQELTIRDMTMQESMTLTTDKNGAFNTSLLHDHEYRVYTKKNEFILLKEAAVSTEGIRQDSTLNCQLVLKPTTIIVHLRVIEKKTKKIIPNATTSITDYDIDWDTTLITNDKGMVTLKVDRNKVYWAHGAKKGFIDADISFNSSNETDKVIDLELALPPIKKGEKFKLENIFYDLNKSTLRPESKTSLDKLAEFIIRNDLRIELSAHTDSRGSSSYNQRLSQARAQSCVDYLIEKGVKKSNIRAKGYGEMQLVNGCKDGVNCSEEEHQENRRTAVQILEVN
ncbi:MAG: OmpA family protein [bacterium]|nr:OmpA family protein [bacterium]